MQGSIHTTQTQGKKNYLKRSVINGGRVEWNEDLPTKANICPSVISDSEAEKDKLICLIRHERLPLALHHDTWKHLLSPGPAEKQGLQRVSLTAARTRTFSDILPGETWSRACQHSMDF